MRVGDLVLATLLVATSAHAAAHGSWGFAALFSATAAGLVMVSPWVAGRAR